MEKKNEDEDQNNTRQDNKFNINLLDLKLLIVYIMSEILDSRYVFNIYVRQIIKYL